jgi:hypothetical protein
MTALDRLVRKEESLGAIREKETPNTHIGLQLVAPFLDVATDDVIFEYIKGGLQEGLAPARAEDAEAELAQKDELLYGQGRASIIDWSLKDKYTASDVTRYREDLLLQQQAAGVLAQLNYNFVGRTVEDFQRRIARHDNLRRRKLDNRLEWLIMGGLSAGVITYNDGKIKFTVDYGRPAGQHNQAPAGGVWGTTTSDPIGDILAVNQYMLDTYGVKLTRGIISTRILNQVWKSERFLAALGMPVLGGTPSATLDPNYLGLAGYTPEGALAVVERATGVKFTVYDGFYRTRPIGSTTFTNNRFTPDNQLMLLPSEGDLGEIDDTEIGFAKTLTSPHPEGNWSSGYYEWEDETRDPWMHVRGSGIKAFPVFPYMEYTYTLNVLV